MTRAANAFATLVGWTLQVVVLGAIVLALGALWGWGLMVGVGALHGLLGWPDGTLGYTVSAVICSGLAAGLIALIWKRGPEDKYAKAVAELDDDPTTPMRRDA